MIFKTDKLYQLISKRSEKNSLDLEKIYSDARFGETKDDRINFFRNSCVKVFLLSIVSTCLAACAIFFSSVSVMMQILCLLIPLIGVVVLYNGKGLIQIGVKKWSSYPDLSYAMLIAVMGVLVPFFTKIHLVSYSTVIIFSLVMAVIICATAFYFLRSNLFLNNNKTNYLAVIGIVVSGCLYSVASITSLNSILDFSAAKNYNVAVIGKNEHKGAKNNLYKIELSKWGPIEQTSEVEVSKMRYEQISVGDSLSITLKEGAFGIPYYDLN
ncbi:hypothetical protein OAT16_02015 [Prolixibacteraceae bacterium]|nr:hypothetical protein [Prolixibacteraceae bacterium]